MNVGIGTEATQFLFWEYINWISGTLYFILVLLFHLHVREVDAWFNSTDWGIGAKIQRSAVGFYQ